MAKVVCAMSGGVDSSVAAMLLKQAGHEVLGVFMRHGIHGQDDAAEECRLDDSPTPRKNRQGCCSAEDAADARRVAHQLGISFYALNFQDAFEGIVDYFVAEYAAGRTPNPCVRCNTDLKFGRLWAYAQAVGADAIATGHYARLERGDGARPRLLRGLDARKDQSYVLFGIAPAMLDKMLLPVGGFEKPAIRQMARDGGLKVGDKPDSYEICFVPNDDYATVVAAHAPQAFAEGPIVDQAGRTVGTHRGLPNYTIGQRHGLGVALGEPAFVTEIRVGENRLVVGRKEDVLKKHLHATRPNWLAGAPGAELRARCQIRSNSPAALCSVAVNAGGFDVAFDEPQSAITPGQAAVLYDEETGQQVLGGGWIETAG